MKVNHYLIERRCPKTGFNEQVIYTGSKRNKPKGWKIVKQAQ